MSWDYFVHVDNAPPSLAIFDIGTYCSVLLIQLNTGI